MLQIALGLYIAHHHLVVRFRIALELSSVVRDSAPEIALEQFTARLCRVVELRLIASAQYIVLRAARQVRRTIVRAVDAKPVTKAIFAQLLLISCLVRSLTIEIPPHLSF